VEGLKAGKKERPMATVFQPYNPNDALGADRSSGDRQRHRRKVRAAIRDNIADLISEQSIIGQSKDKIIKIPLRGIKEYRFVYGQNNPRAAQGGGDSKVGDQIGEAGDEKGDKSGPGEAGDRPGIDYYETDVSLGELIEIMFEDLELPDMERKALREVVAERTSKPKGHKHTGAPVQLDRRKTARTRIRRRLAMGRGAGGTGGASGTGGVGGVGSAAALETAAGERFPFHREDMRYRRRRPDPQRQSSAVVFCIMDTSGSMDRMKKYFARSFFFLLYQFVRTRYEAVEVAFIAHDSQAHKVSEDDFFHKGASGGTLISSGYALTLETIREFYDPEVWNIYAFHCSDGDNFSSDNEAAIKAAGELCALCNLFGYGEIKPAGSYYAGSSMIKTFEEIKAKNFATIKIASKEDVWSGFKSFLSRESEA
jgi:sporulation protein YhbH